MQEKKNENLHVAHRYQYQEYLPTVLCDCQREFSRHVCDCVECLIILKFCPFLVYLNTVNKIISEK
jgi:hypothetical protein